jgi:hypothetical protein
MLAQKSSQSPQATDEQVQRQCRSGTRSHTVGTQGARRIPNPLQAGPSRPHWRPLHNLHFNLRDLVRRPTPTAGARHPGGRNAAAASALPERRRVWGGGVLGLWGDAAEEFRREGGDWEQKPHRSLRFLFSFHALSSRCLPFATPAMSPPLA